jgi:hypothetical protein
MPEAPVLTARTAIHATLARAEGPAPELSAAPSSRPGGRATTGGTAAIPPAMFARPERAETGSPLPTSAHVFARIFPGMILGDRAPPCSTPREIAASSILPSLKFPRDAAPGVRLSWRGVSSCVHSRRAARADVTFASSLVPDSPAAPPREPGVPILPERCRKTAAPGSPGSALIDRSDDPPAARNHPRGTLVPTFTTPSLRI